VREFDRTPR